MKKLLFAAFIGALTLTACDKKTEVEETNTMMVEPDSSAMMPMDSSAMMPMDSTAAMPMTDSTMMAK